MGFTDALLRRGRNDFEIPGVTSGGDPLPALSSGVRLMAQGNAYAPGVGEDGDPLGYARYEGEEDAAFPIYDKGDLRVAQREARHGGPEVVVTDERDLRAPPGQKSLESVGLGIAAPNADTRMDPGTRSLNMAYGSMIGRGGAFTRPPVMGGGMGAGMGMQTMPQAGPGAIMAGRGDMGGGGGFSGRVMDWLGKGENLGGLAQLVGAGASVYGAHKQNQRYEDLRRQEDEARERRQSRHESTLPFYAALLRRANAGG